MGTNLLLATDSFFDLRYVSCETYGYEKNFTMQPGSLLSNVSMT